MAYTFKDMLPIAIIIVVATIAISIGADVVDNVQEEQITPGIANCGTNSTGGTGNTISYVNCSYAYNASENGLESIDELGSWIPTISLVVAASIIIAILVMSFAYGRG